MTDILNIAGINQYYGESHTLWDLDLSVPKGVCLCLMGRNGMGKTTLLKSLMGLIPVRDGRMQFDGHELTGQAAERRAHRGLLPCSRHWVVHRPRRSQPNPVVTLRNFASFAVKQTPCGSP